jgi:hypothetical protein
MNIVYGLLDPSPRPPLFLRKKGGKNKSGFDILIQLYSPSTCASHSAIACASFFSQKGKGKVN